MKATHALAELDKFGSANDPVYYRAWQEGDEPVESVVDEVVRSPGVGDKDARKVRLDYWGVDRQGEFRLIRGTLSGMLSERRRTAERRPRLKTKAPVRCPTCRRVY